MKLINEIDGYQEFTGYGITSCGKVWSFKTNKFLTPGRSKDGYLYVILKNGRKISKNVLIHRLVALAYVPNPDNLETVDHIDENKDHNYVNNLRWLSRGDNVRHSQNKPVKCVETNQIFESTRAAAEKMGLQRGNISSVCRGERKTTGGYHFEYI